MIFCVKYRRNKSQRVQLNVIDLQFFIKIIEILRKLFGGTDNMHIFERYGEIRSANFPHQVVLQNFLTQASSQRKLRKAAGPLYDIFNKIPSMKRILFIFLILFSFTKIYSQQTQTDYYLGKRTYCKKPPDERSVKIYDLGLRCIRANEYIGAASKIFIELIEKDNNFCDAIFLAGVTFRLSNMEKEAVPLYYLADSLAQNRSIEFKQNLATSSLRIGNVKLSRQKYEEMTKYFPESPEGFYGIGLTSLFVEDYANGLENINIAEKKYYSTNKDCQSLKAVLLTMNEKYEDAISYFQKVESNFKKDDNFLGCYALSLKQVGMKKSDDEMINKSKKYYEKVQNKNGLPEIVKKAFKEL